MNAAHPTLPRRVANVGGTTYPERDDSVTTRVDWWMQAYDNVVLIDDGGTYDVRDDLTTAQVLARKTAYTAARRAAGANVIVALTNPPATLFDGSDEIVRQEVNAALLEDPEAYGYDFAVDSGGAPELQNTADTTYYFDGIHFTDAGAAAYAQPLIDSGI